MSRSLEHTTPDDSRLIPSDAETIERSTAFGRQLQEYGDALDSFFTPDYSCTHHRIAFGQFGDGSLNIITEQEADGHSALSLSYHADADDRRGDFYVTKKDIAEVWTAGSKEQYPDWRVAKMLDAAWPSFAVDNTAIRTLASQDKDTVTFKDIQGALAPATANSIPVAETRTFAHERSWSDRGVSTPASALIIVERAEGRKPMYSLEVTLPHEHRPGVRTYVHCIAYIDELFGVSYQVKVDEPSLTRLDLDLSAIATLLDGVLDDIMSSRLGAETDTVDIDAWRDQ